MRFEEAQRLKDVQEQPHLCTPAGVLADFDLLLARLILSGGVDDGYRDPG